MVIHPGALKLAIDKVITGEIQLQDLVSKFLGQDLVVQKLVSTWGCCYPTE